MYVLCKYELPKFSYKRDLLERWKGPLKFYPLAYKAMKYGSHQNNLFQLFSELLQFSNALYMYAKRSVLCLRFILCRSTHTELN